MLSLYWNEILGRGEMVDVGIVRSSQLAACSLQLAAEVVFFQFPPNGPTKPDGGKMFAGVTVYVNRKCKI